MDAAKLEQVALGAVFEAGDALKKHFGRARIVKKKGEIDLVTQADLESEAILVRHIRASFPDHAILAEEGGEGAREGSFLWIIDPLDGTTNYAHGIPIFAISVACYHEGKPCLGLVLNPVSGELFFAQKGKGAFLNKRPVQVSQTRDLGDSLLATGFPYNLSAMAEELMDRFGRCLLKARGLRRLGAAALDLCYVACGRFDGFWEQNLHPWDTAAGALILEEAGGRATDFSLAPYSPYDKKILATNGRIHQALSEVLVREAPAATEERNG